MGNIVQIYKQKSPMKLRNGKTLGIENQDDQCNICFRVKYEPGTLQPCLHSFCSSCRSVIRNVIRDDQQIKRLKAQYPIDYAERSIAEEKAKRLTEEKMIEEQNRTKRTRLQW